MPRQLLKIGTKKQNGNMAKIQNEIDYKAAMERIEIVFNERNLNEGAAHKKRHPHNLHIFASHIRAVTIYDNHYKTDERQNEGKIYRRNTQYCMQVNDTCLKRR